RRRQATYGAGDAAPSDRTAGDQRGAAARRQIVKIEPRSTALSTVRSPPIARQLSAKRARSRRISLLSPRPMEDWSCAALLLPPDSDAPPGLGVAADARDASDVAPRRRRARRGAPAHRGA